MALAVNPNFNLIEVIYPFVLQRIVYDGGLGATGDLEQLDLSSSPSSPRRKLERVFREMVLAPTDKGGFQLFDVPACRKLLANAARLGNISKRRIVLDFLKYSQGWRFMAGIMANYLHYATFLVKRRLNRVLLLLLPPLRVTD